MKTDIGGWITENTNYVIHLTAPMLYKEELTVEVPLVEIIRVSDMQVVAKTPVDVGEDTAPVNEEGGERGFPTEKVSQIRFLKE